jgi:endonuclease YncB( thermonuclease family)
VSKHWKPGKKAVDLQPEVRPSRIRRDPVASQSVVRKVRWHSREWEIGVAVIGITLFALAIFVVTVGFSAITGDKDGNGAAQAQRFGSCDGEGGPNCVIDGDTIRVAGVTVDIAGMQTPQIEAPRCPEEQRRGAQAADRLIQLLNSGKVTLGESVPEADGQSRHKVAVDGQDVGAAMIREGLARESGIGRISWCG